MNEILTRKDIQEQKIQNLDDLQVHLYIFNDKAEFRRYRMTE